jgi:hypothetical protein
MQPLGAFAASESLPCEVRFTDELVGEIFIT